MAEFALVNSRLVWFGCVWFGSLVWFNFYQPCIFISRMGQTHKKKEKKRKLTHRMVYRVAAQLKKIQTVPMQKENIKLRILYGF